MDEFGYEPDNEPDYEWYTEAAEYWEGVEAFLKFFLNLTRIEYEETG